MARHEISVAYFRGNLREVLNEVETGAEIIINRWGTKFRLTLADETQPITATLKTPGDGPKAAGEAIMRREQQQVNDMASKRIEVNPKSHTYATTPASSPKGLIAYDPGRRKLSPGEKAISNRQQRARVAMSELSSGDTTYEPME